MSFGSHFNRARFNRSEVVPEEIAERSIAIRMNSPDISSWLSGWSHRKSHVLHCTVTLTNEPVRLTIHRTTDTDSDDDVYIGTGCESDYKDIRFTTDDGKTPLSYAFPPDFTPDSSSAVVDILIPSITSAGMTIYVYYGNSSASDASAPDTVYLLHDTFQSATLDTNKWIPSDADGWSVSGGILTLYEPGGGWRRIASKSITICQEHTITTIRLKSTHYEDSGIRNEDVSIRDETIPDTVIAAYFANETVGYGQRYMNNSGGCTLVNIMGWSVGAYHILELYRNGKSIWDVDRSGSPVENTNDYTATSCSLNFDIQYSGARLDIESAYIRKHSLNAPTHGIWGSEENPTMISGCYASWYPVAAERTIAITPESIGIVMTYVPAEKTIAITTELCQPQSFLDLQNLYQVAFTAGKHLPDIGGILIGGTSGTRAEVVAIALDSGTWGVDAAGTLYIRILSGGGFIPGEKLNEA